jgi:hypothetical protein
VLPSSRNDTVPRGEMRMTVVEQCASDMRSQACRRFLALARPPQTPPDTRRPPGQTLCAAARIPTACQLPSTLAPPAHSLNRP